MHVLIYNKVPVPKKVTIDNKSIKVKNNYKSNQQNKHLLKNEKCNQKIKLKINKTYTTNIKHN